ncbi:MAG: hypothetical protein A3B41_00990 [Candidatus Levybacteria bacterium RIFCSPLOWO2_01_FULL_37_26]|nr:MAG: hypothetical protein A3E40_01035 [Candidatus Levybacteria bacterium RIFCSPHIGHO2_12_FULL_37_9]OGH38125.1 MAG: hypothetical protein A3B41_00990 [Candidatus Levybacteria bacterium RIFCSPLOWO2_01_FULL_37_26]
MVRVRIAPSPTGIPHIGNTRTALFNFLFARHNKGKFIVRIEDTDRARLVPESEEAIYEILKWLGLTWDEKYKQSERVEIYKKHAQQLLKKDLAYKDENAIRFKMSKTGETSWDDLIGEKHISFKNETQEDFIIIKSDGFPTYNFANVIDDHLMEISHVIRGEEFISSTPKHIHLYQSFGWKHPFFAHLPIVLGPDKTKLSKRHGAKSVLDYRNDGYLKEALLNFMVFLGWNPGGNKEIMDINEMTKLFDLNGINAASPIFDVRKLEWMNGEYIRIMDNQTLKSKLVDFYKEDKDVLSFMEGDPKTIDFIVGLAKTRMKMLKEFKDLVISKIPKLLPHEKNIAKSLYEKFSVINNWNKEKILSIMKEVLSTYKIKGNILYKIVTGFETGLPLPESLEILGKEKVLARLKKVTV